MRSLDLSVYVVTDQSIGTTGSFWDSLEAVLDAGATVLQVREKGSARALYETALRILPLTRARRIPLIVNDRLDVAMALDADGVHLGQSDLDAKSARRLWGRRKWIGVSATTDQELKRAERDGADYVGVGAVFPTATKLDATPFPLTDLPRLTAFTRLPVVGIGGITVENARLVFQAGCVGVAVVSAVWAADSPAQAVRTLQKIAKESRS